MEDISTNSAHAVVRSSSELLTITDMCFEMYSLEELEIEKKVRRDIARCYPHLHRNIIRKIVSVARGWKRTLHDAGSYMH